MANLLKISEAASLALHTMSLLAAHPEGRMTIQEMAKALHGSEHHLAKVLRRLSNAGLVRGTRGPGGGCTLGKPARAISLLQIFESIEGPVGPGHCLLGKRVCDGKTCVLGGLVTSVQDEVRRYFKKTRLDRLAASFEIAAKARRS